MIKKLVDSMQKGYQQIVSNEHKRAVEKYNSQMNSIPVPSLKFLQINQFMVEKYAQDFHPFNASIYNPPESFGEQTDMSGSQDVKSVKSMIWGVGMTLLYFITRNQNRQMTILSGDFKNQYELAKKISKIVKNNKLLSDSGKDFVLSCLQIDPRSRLKIGQLKKHHWLQNFKITSIEQNREQKQKYLEEVYLKIGYDLMVERIRNLIIQLISENLTNIEIKKLIAFFMSEGSKLTKYSDIKEIIFQEVKEKPYFSEDFQRQIHNVSIQCEPKNIELNIIELLASCLAYKDMVYSLLADRIPKKMLGKQFIIAIQQTMNQNEFKDKDDNLKAQLEQIQSIFGGVKMITSNLVQIFNILGMELSKLRRLVPVIIEKLKIQA